MDANTSPIAASCVSGCAQCRFRLGVMAPRSIAASTFRSMSVAFTAAIRRRPSAASRSSAARVMPPLPPTAPGIARRLLPRGRAAWREHLVMRLQILQHRLPRSPRHRYTVQQQQRGCRSRRDSGGVWSSVMMPGPSGGRCSRTAVNPAAPTPRAAIARVRLLTTTRLCDARLNCHPTRGSASASAARQSPRAQAIQIV